MKSQKFDRKYISSVISYQLTSLLVEHTCKYFWSTYVFLAPFGLPVLLGLIRPHFQLTFTTGQMVQKVDIADNEKAIQLDLA